jgi:hypothetical protein
VPEGRTKQKGAPSTGIVTQFKPRLKIDGTDYTTASAKFKRRCVNAPLGQGSGCDRKFVRGEMRDASLESERLMSESGTLVTCNAPIANRSANLAARANDSSGPSARSRQTLSIRRIALVLRVRTNLLIIQGVCVSDITSTEVMRLGEVGLLGNLEKLLEAITGGETKFKTELAVSCARRSLWVRYRCAPKSVGM